MGMEPRVEIRLLTEADTPSYHQLRLRALREEPEAFGAAYEERVLRPVAETADRLRPLDAPAARFTLGAFVACERLAGMVTFSQRVARKERHRGTITAMYVAPEARGQGAGRALLSGLIQRARALPELEQIELSVVTTNAAAGHLYLVMGFAEYAREPRALKVGGRALDEAYMVLRLRAAGG